MVKKLLYSVVVIVITWLLFSWVADYFLVSRRFIEIIYKDNEPHKGFSEAMILLLVGISFVTGFLYFIWRKK